MVCASVPISGAGTSRCGPRMLTIVLVHLLVTSSFSLTVNVVGSTVTPPLPPPNGTSTNAVFQVIRLASALTSSKSTDW